MSSSAKPSIENDLEAPLLKNTLNRDDASGSNKDVQIKKSLNILSTGTGFFLGLMSQLILSSTIWDQSILKHPIRDLLLFSFAWAFLTCIFVNCAMSLFFRDMKATFYRSQVKGKNSGDDSEGEDLEWNETSSSIEVFLIGGALVSITAFWLTLDFGAIPLPMSASTVVHVVIAATVFYIFFISLTIPCKHATESSWNCLVASNLGLMIGFGSQSSLSAMFWSGLLPRPDLSNLLLFSILWSATTIFVTFLGCLILRCLKPNSKSQMEGECVYLRMESFYVFSSLVGISFAWISIDVATGMTRQIVPSALMLVVSLLLFRVVLYCFPEEKCLEDFKDSGKASAGDSIKEQP